MTLIEYYQVTINFGIKPTGGIMNIVILHGRLGKDAELNYTPEGKPVVEFSVATNENIRNKTTGETSKHTEWFVCNWWGKTAESQADFLKKGTEVVIEGKQRTQKWEKDGQQREKKTVMCKTVRFFNSMPKKQPDINGNRMNNENMSQENCNW